MLSATPPSMRIKPAKTNGERSLNLSDAYEARYTTMAVYHESFGPEALQKHVPPRTKGGTVSSWLTGTE